MSEPVLMYLASPYTHPDKSVKHDRFAAACSATAALMGKGQMVFSPIAHSHPLTAHGAPSDWLFWKDFDRLILEACGVLGVLMLDGWKESVGVTAEIALAKSLDMPINYLNPVEVMKD